MKSFKVLWLVVAMSLSIVLLTGCKETIVKLEVPENVIIRSDSVSWDAVENASNYSVDVDGDVYEVDGTSYRILINLPGSYAVKVRANGVDNYENSDWSSSVTYTINEPAPIIYQIDETFDEDSQASLWGLGDIDDMHTVKDGKLTLTNTGLTPYPSRGKKVKVTLSEFPYLAVKVDDLGGDNARWSIKILLAGDVTSSRSVTPNDMSTSGIFYFDLTKVDGLEEADTVEFDLYIYIIDTEGCYVELDYLKSVSRIPETNNFNTSDGITSENADVTSLDGVLSIMPTDGNDDAVVTLTQYVDTTLAHMLDLFVTQIGEDTTFSLRINDQLVIDQSNRFGHFGIDLLALDMNITGDTTFEFTTNGLLVLDRLRTTEYQAYMQMFDGFDGTSIYELADLDGSADVGISEDQNFILYRISSLSGQAEATFSGVTSISTYPKFSVDVASIEDSATLQVLVNGRQVLSITEAGEYTADMTSYYLSGYSRVSVKFVLQATGDSNAEITSFGFVRDETLSMNAYPEKGEALIRSGLVLEEGNQTDNWTGDSIVFSRNGQIWIVNSGYFSKGEVFAKDVDLLQNRFLNVKVDELTEGATWKLDFVYDNGLPTQFVKTIQNENMMTGTLTYDLYSLLGLDETTKVSTKISLGIFIVGGSDKIVKFDFINMSDEPLVENEITVALPVSDVSVTVGKEVATQASLKYPLGDVSVTVTNESDVDVTSTVLLDGIFSTDVEGVYTLTYSYNDLVEKTRTITVTSQPVIVTDNVNTSMNYDEVLSIVAEVSPLTSEEVVYEVFFNDVDVSDSVLVAATEGLDFMPTEVGIYTVHLSSASSNKVTFTVEVVTGWTSETSGNNANTLENGVLTFSYSGGFYWPKHEKTQIVTQDKPFLVIDVKSITGGTWKLDIPGFIPNAVPDTTSSDLVIIDLTSKIDDVNGKEMVFSMLIVGETVTLEINAFDFLSLEEVGLLYNEINSVVPETNPTVTVGQSVDLSAQLKYAVDGEVVSVMVLDENLVDVTSTLVIDGQFTAVTPGVYTVNYESSLAESVTRTITVLTDEDPIILTTNDATTSVLFDVDYALNFTVDNAVPGVNLSYTVLKDSVVIDATTVIDSEGNFNASNTGVYVVTASYENASDLMQTITVETGWVAENLTNGGAISSSYTDGTYVFTYNGAFYWPIFKELYPVTTDNTPYLIIDVESITGGTWKLQLGDPYSTIIVAEGTTTGQIVIDLRDHVAAAGYGETNKELNMTLVIYVVGGSVDLTINSIEFTNQLP